MGAPERPPPTAKDNSPITSHRRWKSLHLKICSSGSWVIFLSVQQEVVVERDTTTGRSACFWAPSRQFGAGSALPSPVTWDKPTLFLSQFLFFI